MSNHPFHLVDYSPWPYCGSLGVMTLTSGIIIWFYKLNLILFRIGTLIVLLTILQWWRDVTRERTFQGLHTSNVVLGLKYGIIIFILSEVFFFISFFWCFFHRRLSPSIEIGLQWPPLGIKSFNCLSIPILNTIILLSSGISITWAHNSLLNNNYDQSVQGIFLTIFLGIYFTLLQLYEYLESFFSISDSIYGSIFFISTGFHGFHVIVGTIFIVITFIRFVKLHFSYSHYIGFESASLYWHFVDLVWLFLYVSVYWWGNYSLSII